MERKELMELIKKVGEELGFNNRLIVTTIHALYWNNCADFDTFMSFTKTDAKSTRGINPSGKSWILIETVQERIISMGIKRVVNVDLKTIYKELSDLEQKVSHLKYLIEILDKDDLI